MKLVYASGSNEGKEIDLKPPFISLGRETDNDIILTEEEASRYHAKIEKDGLIWIVRDLGSSNGVRLNGQKIDDSAPIENKDELHIGGSAFTVIDPSVAEKPAVNPAAAPTEAVGRASDRPDDKPIPKGNDGAQKRVRLMVAGLFAMLVIFIALFLVMAPAKPKRTKYTPEQIRKARLDAAPLHLVFKHEASGDASGRQNYNMSIYEVTIEDHKMHARVVNLTDGISIKPDPVDLSEAEEEELKNALLSEDTFIKAESLPAKERENSHERIYLMIRAGNRGNCVEYINETGLLPTATTDAIDTIKRVVERKMDIPRMSIADAFKRARELYSLASRNYLEKRVHDLNLYKAIQQAREALVILEGYKKMPPYYKELQQLHNTCKAEHNAYIEEMKKKAFIEEKVDTAKALARYRDILKHIEDTNDKEYRSAKEKAYLLDRKLKKELR